MDLIDFAKKYAKLRKDMGWKMPSRFDFDQAFYSMMPDHKEHCEDAYKLVQKYYDEGE